MADAVPNVETVIAAIKTRIETIGSIGTVYKGGHGYEDDVEFLQKNGFLAGASPSFDLWFIGKAREEPFSGPATGEDYARYVIEIRHWCVRTGLAGQSDWDEQCRAKDTQVIAELSDNAAVFAIGGQEQLHTATTVEQTDHGPRDIVDDLQNGMQRLYATTLELKVESRRWS